MTAPVPGPGSTIGANLSMLRAWRRTTLRALAGLAGISYSYLGELERGEKIPTTAIIDALADALGVQPDLITGSPTTNSAVSAGARLALDVTRAMLEDYDLGDPPSVIPRPWPKLASDLDQLNTALRADYIGQAQVLARLVPELLAVYYLGHEHARDALVGLMYSYYAASCVSKNLGGVDGWPQLAAQRARIVAGELADPAWMAYAEYVRAYATGQASRARQYDRVNQALTTLYRDTRLADEAAVQVAGMLHLSAAGAAVALRRADDALTHITHAKDLSARVPEVGPGLGHLYFTSHNVGIWEVGLQVDLGAAGKVAELARPVHPETIPAADRAAVYWMDLGRGLAAEKTTQEQAVNALWKAYQTAPQLVPAKPLVRDTVRYLMPRVGVKHTEIANRLRYLGHQLGLAPSG
ncbi:helix-turn-helix domain-containing protein [Kutzneria sp. 744]|uniref:helix-turn-helix domain-containing protein n=1 Tax=Kutzneria sp. (strain 744) TaxID=345341 RepID=UPI0003EEAF7D|nr:helix-turn-helix transcriptional regulator [Kutzneria sp. 744]EWM19809.1 DNA-binding protein [Kutzneria sp. 744]